VQGLSVPGVLVVAVATVLANAGVTKCTSGEDTAAIVTEQRRQGQVLADLTAQVRALTDRFNDRRDDEHNEALIRSLQSRP
jgi:hypothetical protein